MFGISDFWILAAYVMSIMSAAACVIYGAYNWNRGDSESDA